MIRARPLALAGALVPVIGSTGPAPARRQRAGAARHWRKPAVMRDYPALNLTIRPAFRFQFDLGMLRSEVQHFSQTLWKPASGQAAVTGPRGAAGLRTVELHWQPPAQPNAAPATAAMHNTPAEFAAQAQRKPAAPISSPQPRTAKHPPAAPPLREWRAHSAIRPQQRPANRAPHSPVLHWAQAGHPSIIGAEQPALISLTRAQPQATALPAAVPHTPAPHTPRTTAPRLPRTELSFAAPSRHNPAPPAPLARSIAPPRPHSAAPAPPPSRRPAIDLAWQPRADPPATTQDIAALARTLGAPEITRSASSARTPATAHTPTSPAALPDTARIVDEVIAQIERRFRSDRLRRGL